MQITTPLSDELGRYLNLSSLELKLTAGNMANIDTPGYRTVGFDFAEEMSRSMADAAARRKYEMKAGQEFNQEERPVTVAFIGGLVERPDGNNVSMDREGMRMAEAQLRFRTGVELLKGEYNRELDAIHGDSK